MVQLKSMKLNFSLFIFLFFYPFHNLYAESYKAEYDVKLGKINIGNLVFCPRLITTIFAVIFFLLFIYLGFWQLDRAEQKREFQSFYNERHQEEIINLNNNLISNTSDFLWRRVSATGIFLEEQQK